MQIMAEQKLIFPLPHQQKSILNNVEHYKVLAYNNIEQNVM